MNENEYRSRLQILMAECRKALVIGVIDPSRKPDFMKEPGGVKGRIDLMQDLLTDEGDPEITMDDIKNVGEELVKLFGDCIPGIETDCGEAVYEDFRCPEKVLREHLDSCTYTCTLTEAAQMLIQTYGYNEKTRPEFNRTKFFRESNVYGMRKIGKEDFLRMIQDEPFRLVGNYPFSPVTPNTDEYFTDYVLSRIDAKSIRPNDPYVESVDENTITLDNHHKIVFNWLDNKVEEYYTYQNNQVNVLVLKTIHATKGRVDYLRYAVFVGEQGELDLGGFRESEFHQEDTPEQPLVCRFYAWAYKYLTSGINPWKTMDDKIDLCDKFVAEITDRLGGRKPKFEMDRTNINYETPSIEGVELDDFPMDDCVTYLVRGEKLEEKTKVCGSEVDFKIKKTSSGRIPGKSIMVKVAKHIINDLNRRSGAFCIKDSDGDETQWDMDRNGTEYTLIEKSDQGQNKLVFDMFQGKISVKEFSFR